MKKLSVVLTCVLVGAVAPGADALLIANLVDPSDVAPLVQQYQITYLDRTPGGPFVLFSVEESRADQVQIEMSLDPRVVWVEDDVPLDSPEGADQRPEDIRARVGGTIPAIFDTKAGAFYNSGSLKQVGWRATGFAPSDRRVRVAVLDTGLSPHQPVLWEHVAEATDATKYEGEPGASPFDLPTKVDTNGNGVYDEGVGHGTFVASIVATTAPYADLFIAKVADSDGVATSWRIIKGLAFAVENGCELANVSLGSVDQPAALGDVIEWARLKGLLVVAGAGNDATDRALYPARFSEVVGVAGVGPDDVKADFSNWDGHLLQAAPSVDVAGAWWEGGMVGWSGTSFAAPFVTGCLADTARKRPRWKPGDVLVLCETTGKDLDALNPAYAGELGLRLDWGLLLKRQRAFPVRSGRR